MRIMGAGVRSGGDDQVGFGWAVCRECTTICEGPYCRLNKAEYRFVV